MSKTTNKLLARGWRTNEAYTNEAERIFNLLKKAVVSIAPQAQCYLSGGAIRELAYPWCPEVQSIQNLFPKDLDFYVCGLKDKEESNKVFELIKNTFLTQTISYTDDNRFRVERYTDGIFTSETAHHLSIDFIEGKETILDTVSAFDWYECTGWTDNIKSNFSEQPSLSYLQELFGSEYQINYKYNQLTLLKYTHPARTLQRGLKIISKLALALKLEDIQLLSTQAILEEGYGKIVFKRS